MIESQGEKEEENQELPGKARPIETDPPEKEKKSVTPEDHRSSLPVKKEIIKKKGKRKLREKSEWDISGGRRNSKMMWQKRENKLN